MLGERDENQAGYICGCYAKKLRMLIQFRRQLEGWRGPLTIAAIAAAVTLFFFTPRFAIWRGLGVPTAWMYPEVNRAMATLNQVDDPFGEIRGASNMVIQWRLFFPLLAHVLRIPDGVYLALPHLGCLLVLGFVARLLRDRGWAMREAGAAAVVIGSTSWFFVSTGWLAYFDSWCVLGMLLVAFARRREWVVAAMLVSPWVDERFVFALPISLLVRGEYFRQDLKTWLKDAAVGGAALLPWLAIRAGIWWFDNDEVTGRYVRSLWERRERLYERSHLEGAWHGLRWGWVFAIAGVLAARGRAALGVVAALTLGIVFLLADDLSRSTAVLMPIVLLGVVCRDRQQHIDLSCGRVMCLAALNLLFPAKHIVADSGAPILYLHREIERWGNPPPEVDPDALVSYAEAYRAQGRAKLARAYLDAALAINGRHGEALRGRAELNLTEGNVEAAATDLGRALDAAPRDPDLLRMAARIFLAGGQQEKAAEVLRAALASSVETWPHRAAALAELQRIEAVSEP